MNRSQGKPPSNGIVARDIKLKELGAGLAIIKLKHSFGACPREFGPVSKTRRSPPQVPRIHAEGQWSNVSLESLDVMRFGLPPRRWVERLRLD